MLGVKRLKSKEKLKLLTSFCRAPEIQISDSTLSGRSLYCFMTWSDEYLIVRRTVSLMAEKVQHRVFHAVDDGNGYLIE